MPDLDLEIDLRRRGHAVICGVDEAGRGPWAGPVVAGAAVIDVDAAPDDLLLALDDSKKLSAVKREALLERFDGVILTAVGRADVDEIDALNILQASLLAMRRAVDGLSRDVDFALIDGNKVPDLGITPCRAVIKGDGRSLSIAAASIVAKVTRDKEMCGLARKYPGYGWERNAGYGTREHQEALRELGVTPIHRRSFAPIKKLIGSLDIGA